MKLSEDYSAGSNIIRAYSQAGININGQVYSASLVVSNYQLIPDWPVRHIAELNQTHLQTLLDTEPEVIIIGTGRQLQFPPQDIYASVINQGMAIEFMDSGAACRTYSILLSENRRVSAGIIWQP